MTKRLIVNGKEEKPIPKVKLYKHKSAKDIKELIKKKRLEQENESSE